MDDLFPPVAATIGEQIACVERELGFRSRCYPRWVKDGKLTQTAADLELSRMRAVLATLLSKQAVLPAEVSIAVATERERVLTECCRHMRSSVALRVADKVRAGRE